MPRGKPSNLQDYTEAQLREIKNQTLRNVVHFRNNELRYIQRHGKSPESLNTKTRKRLEQDGLIIRHQKTRLTTTLTPLCLELLKETEK